MDLYVIILNSFTNDIKTKKEKEKTRWFSSVFFFLDNTQASLGLKLNKSINLS